MGHPLIPVTQRVPHRLLLSAPWDDGQVWGNEGSSHGRPCPATKEAAHVSFTISAGALLSWTQSALVHGSFPVKTLMHVSPMLSYSLNLCLGGLVSPRVLAFGLLKCDTLKPQIFRSSFSFIPVTDRLSSHSEKLLSVLRKSSLQPSLASLLSLIAHWQFYSSLPCCGYARRRTDNPQYSNQ